VTLFKLVRSHLNANQVVADTKWQKQALLTELIAGDRIVREELRDMQHKTRCDGDAMTAERTTVWLKDYTMTIVLRTTQGGDEETREKRSTSNRAMW